MFATLQRIFGAARPEEEPEFDPGDHRVAAAALAVHAIAIDGVIDDTEKATLRSVLQAHFSLSAEETEALIEEARRRDLEAVDLYAFTSVLKRRLDDEGRLAVVEMLWRVIHADGGIHEFEDNLVWRVAELLGVSSRERIRLRRSVGSETDVVEDEG